MHIQVGDLTSKKLLGVSGSFAWVFNHKMPQILEM